VTAQWVVPAELRIEHGKRFPEAMKLVGWPVKVISRSVGYMIARAKLVIERQELSIEPRRL
jgi:hypothetical protein